MHGVKLLRPARINLSKEKFNYRCMKPLDIIYQHLQNWTPILESSIAIVWIIDTCICLYAEHSMQVSISRNCCIIGDITCSRFTRWFSSLKSSLQPTTIAGTFTCPLSSKIYVTYVYTEMKMINTLRELNLAAWSIDVCKQVGNTRKYFHKKEKQN